MLKVTLPGSRPITRQCQSEPGLSFQMTQLVGPEFLLILLFPLHPHFEEIHPNDCHNLALVPSEGKAPVSRVILLFSGEAAGWPCPQRH